MPLVDHFHWLASIYDRVITTVQPERLKALLRLPAEGYILDVGGGTGRVAQTLADGSGQIVVLDESAGMLWEARDKGLMVTRARAERLPFANGTFSRLLMVDAFHHLSDHARVVAELVRVMAPDGWLVVEEPNIERGAVKLVALFEKLALMRSRFYSSADMAQMFRSMGVEVEVTHDGSNFWLAAQKPGVDGGAFG